MRHAKPERRRNKLQGRSGCVFSFDTRDHTGPIGEFFILKGDFSYHWQRKIPALS